MHPAFMSVSVDVANASSGLALKNWRAWIPVSNGLWGGCKIVKTWMQNIEKLVGVTEICFIRGDYKTLVHRRTSSISSTIAPSVCLRHCSAVPAVKMFVSAVVY